MWRKLLFWKRTELGEELEFYREMREAELRDSGLPPEEARRAARRAMGNVTLIKEEARAAWMVRWLDELGQDLGYAGRSLRAAPLFTAMAVGALGLGIGVNTSLFTLFNAVALRPWSVKDAERVVSVYQVDQRRNRLSYRGLEHPFFEYLRDRTSTMSAVAGTKNLGTLLMERQGQRVNVLGGATSGNYFEAMGARMALGRAYGPEDDRPAATEAYAVVSYSFWQSQLQGRPDIVGSEITLNRAPLRVVGVAAEEFRGTSADAIGVWIPLHGVRRVQPENSFIGDAGSCCVDVLGRLKAGVTREQAQSEATVLGNQWLGQQGRPAQSMLLTRAAFFSHPRIREKLGPVMALLGLAVGLVLMLACANVSNLLLARAVSRRKEIAVRLSLGAGRGRLIRQLLTESLVLSGAGALAGLAIAFVLPRMLMDGFLPAAALSFRLEPDAAVLAFSLGLGLVTTVVFGLTPAFQATRLNVQDALKGRQGGLGRWDLRRGLAAAQVGLCVVILIGAALLLRGLVQASRSEPGFETRNLAVVHLDLSLFGYDEARAVAMNRALEERLLALPGVEGVTHSDILPFGNNGNGTDFVPANGGRSLERASVGRVAPQHLETMGIQLAAGRGFVAGDVGRPVAIINEVAARVGWAGEDPVGRRFRAAGRDYEVIGVMRNSVYRSFDSKLEPVYYLPSAGGRWANFLVRLRDPRQLSLVRDAVRAIDAKVLPEINRLEDDAARALQPARMAAGIAFGLGGFALTLAGVGLYGVVAYNVAQRTKEIGLRMALGARPWEVIRLVLDQNLRAVLAGVVLGLAGAAYLSRLLVSLLYGLSPLDPVAYAGVAACLVATVLGASLIPARRAARTDPMEALRIE